MTQDSRPILLGYIATPEGEAALQRAIREAQHRQATLVVAHALAGLGSLDVVDGVEIDASVDPITPLLVESGVQFEMRSIADSGDAADDLISLAESLDADMIVIGLRRRSPVGKLIMGSNAQRILLNASCAVLAVKPG